MVAKVAEAKEALSESWRLFILLHPAKRVEAQRKAKNDILMMKDDVNDNKDDNEDKDCCIDVLHIMQNQGHAHGKPWTPKEDNAIHQLHSWFGGNQWSKIKSEFGNSRVDHDARIRWVRLERSRKRRAAAMM